MRKVLVCTTTALSALFALATVAVDGASAKPGWKGGGNPPGFNKGLKSGWNNAGQPPGWSRSRGMKRGWDRGVTTGRGSMPPGLR
jgi:hypothetical protein